MRDFCMNKTKSGASIQKIEGVSLQFVLFIFYCNADPNCPTKFNMLQNYILNNLFNLSNSDTFIHTSTPVTTPLL